jgi:thioredoxin 1
VNENRDDTAIFDVDLDDFDRRVVEESRQRPVLVDLWAEWCAPCLVIAPILERVVTERAGAIALARVEVDRGHNMKLAGRYQVRGFPTVLLLRDGEELGRFSGAKPVSFVDEFLDQLL